VAEGPRGTAFGEDGAVDEIAITGNTIKLGQLLKLTNLVDQGADAKLLLASDLVTVNDEVETRRGRQLVPGDVVRVGDTSVRVT
jgi:ribosome-associated protein